MRLLPSPSISSSSSTSFDPNMCTSKSATASCLSGILRRILCSRTLPTYPSDLITETSSIVCDNKNHLGKVDQPSNGATSSPGIVARLMGLESLPETAASSDHSMLRSRSMNSAEFRDECVVDRKKSLHRRVKSTLSVREMPTFIETENEEFFVLSFDNGGGNKNGEVKIMKRREKVVAENNEEDEEKIKKMVSRILGEGCLSTRISDEHNQEDFGSDEGLIHDSHWKGSNLDSQPKFNLINYDELTHDVARSRKKKKKKHSDQQPECSSEDSSPVSVFDFNQFLIDPSDQEKSNPRRKFSAELESEFMIQDQNSKRRTDPCHISPKKPCKILDGSTLWSEICKPSEREVILSNWVSRNNSNFQDFEDVGQDLGLQILDQLLEELVDQQLVD